MAAEAVLKVKQAEEKGSELVRSANDEAKELIRKAETDGLNRQKAIIGEANRMKQEMIEQANNEAVQDCADLLSEGKAENQRILNPDPIKLKQAVEIVMERIVNVNGNS